MRVCVYIYRRVGGRARARIPAFMNGGEEGERDAVVVGLMLIRRDG